MKKAQVVNKIADSIMTTTALLKWHPSQEGDLNHENQDCSRGRAPG